MTRWITRPAAWGFLFLFTAVGAFAALLTDAEYPLLQNLIQNASFEMDWMHNATSSKTRFLLLEQSDWGYAQSDGIPDSWVCREGRLDREVHRLGHASLRLQGDAWQVVYICGQTDSKDGGANYNAFGPLPSNLRKAVKPRPLRVGVWCKTQDATAPPALGVQAEYVDAAKGGKAQTAAFAKGTHDWEYQEILVPVDAAQGPLSSARVNLTYRGGGTVWFDGAFAVEEGPDDEPNLLGNGTFQTMETDWPAEWSRPAIWSWARRDYYRFTGWSHGDGKMTGGVEWPALGANGER